MKRPPITPGPWKWSGTCRIPSKNCYLAGPSGNLYVGVALEGFTDNEANARAIATVPDLFSIVEAVASHGQHEPDERGPCMCSRCQLTRDARAVLIKAGYEFEN